MSNMIGDGWFPLSDDVSLRWMLTLLHFLWQGTVVGVVVAVLASLRRHSSASQRYGIYLFALLSLPFSVALTFCIIEVPAGPINAAIDLPATTFDSIQAETVVLPEAPVVVSPLTALPNVQHSDVPTSPIVVRTPQDANGEREALEPRWITLLSLLAPWITAGYVIGALGFLLRLTIALWGGHRLRSGAIRQTDSHLLELIATEARRVGLRFVPVVAYCERVAVPTVVGILRPMVLLPTSILTGLTPEEFTAIIGHEFAHIRRYDLWVNLLQRVIESLLFFHPVVWFLSRRLSDERELCCDDLVVRSGCSPMNYAGALLRMAELCSDSRSTNVAALAVDGNEPSLLEHRIVRLMNADKSPRLQLTRAGVLALVLTLVLLPIIPNTLRNWVQAEEPLNLVALVDQTQPEASSEGQADKKVTGNVTISGRIVREDGTPATDKGWMYYISRNQDNSSNGVADQYTDSFSFKCPKGTIWIIHFPENNAPTWVGPFDLTTLDELNDVKLVLKPGTSKLVRITNEDGQPIANATLVAHPVVSGIGTSGPVHEQISDENGEILLEHLADTAYKLRCSATGYQTLRSEPLAMTGDQPLVQKLQHSEITTGIVLNADNSPAAGARLLACAEIFADGGANSMTSSGDGSWFGTEFAKTDSDGKFSLNQLSSGSRYLFVIETTDQARAIVHSIEAGQKDLKFSIPPRLDLHVNIVGDTSKLPQRQGKLFVAIRQHVKHRPGKDVPPREYQISAGDILGVYIEGVLPFNPPNQPPAPPVNFPDQTSTLPSSIGYPIAVQDDGTVSLPLVKPLDVDGLTLEQVRDAIRDKYIDEDILRPEKARPIVTLIKARNYDAIYGGLIGADVSVELSKTGKATFRGLAVDLFPSPEKQHVEVSLGYSNELTKTVEMNLAGTTEVEFILPEDQTAAKIDAVEIKHPHCIVDVENLKTRSLADAVAAFNRESLESPIGVLQQPISEKETLDAIATSLSDAHVTDTFKAVLKEIAESKQLPPNTYFRRFTRFDDERQMQEVWWVRLVVESEAGPVYSVPVRTTARKSRPYTQMERQQNASGMLTLINRFVSYFAEPPNILLAKEFPKDAVDQLVNSADTSIKAKDTEMFQSLFDWKGVSDETREIVKSEFEMLTDATIHSVKVTPRNFRGELVHWSAYQHYQPNLEIVGDLDIEYSKAPMADNQQLTRTLSLEMGQVGNELRLVNYAPKGERKFPEGNIERQSIRGHNEPLADGTYLGTTIITNPGLLLSAHVANEEVRLHDPDNASPERE